MAMDVSRTTVWAATIQDRPGGLAGKLKALSDAGANLDFAIARRAPDKPGKGVVFLTPLSGAKQLAAAKKAGFKKTASLHSVRVEGPDKPGIGACMTEALAEAGINVRGVSVAVVKRRFICYLAFDTSADATKAVRIIKKMH